MADTDTAAPVPQQPPRKRAGWRIIERSANREEYHRLLEGGWSCRALAEYAARRNGERIHHKTFWDYRNRHGIAAPPARLQKSGTWDPEQVADVVSVRQELLHLQMGRVAGEAEREKAAGVLSEPLSREVRLLSELVDDVKGDMQDLGWFPRAGDHADGLPGVGGSAGRDAAGGPSLAEILAASEDAAAAVARALHENVIPLPARARAAGEAAPLDGRANGHGNGRARP